MKKFNLEEALAGKPVVTSQGLAVTQIVYFEKTHNAYQVFGVVNGEVESWTIQGKYNQKYDNHNKDLFMLSEKKSIWINVYQDGNGKLWTSGDHDTRDLAEMVGHNSQGITYKHIKTIEITNEP